MIVKNKKPICTENRTEVRLPVKAFVCEDCAKKYILCEKCDLLWNPDYIEKIKYK